MLDKEENLIDVEKVNDTPEKIKLIYLGILALGIKIESTVIPLSNSELDLLIEYLIEILQRNDELIRRACSLLEQIEISDDKNHYYGIVKDYLDQFFVLSQCEEFLDINIPSENQSYIALKILTDLLFYSGKSGKYFLKQQLQCL